MATRGYRRNSSGFMQPIGNVPSGTTSGPGHFTKGQLTRDQKNQLIALGKSEGLTENESKAIAYSGTNPTAYKRWRAAEAKVTENIKESQRRHDKVMSDIAKTESGTFDRVNKALNASKESDPKDKLGNTVPSAQTQYLEQQLISILGQKSQRAKQVATPEAAGVTLEQQKTFREEGPTAQPPKPMELMDTRGITGLAPPQAPGKDFSQPASIGERVEVALPGGGTVQVTIVALADANGMIRVRLQDGSEAAIHEAEINRIDLEEGAPTPDPGGGRGRFQAHEQRRAIMRDIETGL